MLPGYAVATVLGSRLSLLVRRIGLDLLLPIGASIYCLATTLYAVAHGSVWVVALVMLIAGIGSGFTFAAMPGLILRSTPVTETGSAMSFNTLLRFLGFAIGSTLATTMLAVFSDSAQPDTGAFLAAVWINAAIWLATALICLVLIPSRPKETTS